MCTVSNDNTACNHIALQLKATIHIQVILLSQLPAMGKSKSGSTASSSSGAKGKAKAKAAPNTAAAADNRHALQKCFLGQLTPNKNDSAELVQFKNELGKRYREGSQDDKTSIINSFIANNKKLKNWQTQASLVREERDDSDQVKESCWLTVEQIAFKKNLNLDTQKELIEAFLSKLKKREDEDFKDTQFEGQRFKYYFIGDTIDKETSGSSTIRSVSSSASTKGKILLDNADLKDVIPKASTKEAKKDAVELTAPQHFLHEVLVSSKKLERSAVMTKSNIEPLQIRMPSKKEALQAIHSKFQTSFVDFLSAVHAAEIALEDDMTITDENESRADLTEFAKNMAGVNACFEVTLSSFKDALKDLKDQAQSAKSDPEPALKQEGA